MPQWNEFSYKLQSSLCVEGSASVEDLVDTETQPPSLTRISRWSSLSLCFHHGPIPLCYQEWGVVCVHMHTCAYLFLGAGEVGWGRERQKGRGNLKFQKT